MLKFEIECNLDKFDSLERNAGKDFSLPPKLDIPRFKEEYRFLGDPKKLAVYIGSVVIFIFILSLVMPKRVPQRK